MRPQVEPTGPQTGRLRIYMRLVGLLEQKWLLLPAMFIGYAMVSGGNVGFADWLRTVTGALSDQDRANALNIALLLVGYLILRGIGTLMGSYTNERLGAKLAHRLRTLIFHRLLHSPMSYFDDNTQGDEITKVTYMANAASSGITQIGLIAVRDSLQVLGLFGYLLYLNWQMTLYLLVSIPLLALLFVGATRRLRTLVAGAQSGMGHIAQAVTETVSGVAVVKIFQAEEREAKILDKQSDQLMRFFINIGLVQGTLIPFVQVLTGIFVAGISYMALSGQVGALDGETFVAYFVALGMLFAPLRQISRIHVQFEICSIAARAIFDFLDSEGEPETGKALPPSVKGQVVARNLSFTYPNGTPALNNINFTLKPGTITALVGHSGSGKTTITSLLCGFYTDWRGSFTLDGQEISQLSIASLRQQIALVNQQVMLFSGTIAENIAYGRPDATRDEIEQAAKNGDAWSFISELPQGLDTFVGSGGAQLSGGQRQRLSIARAFLCDSPIVILDEATAALDNISERRIQKVLRRLARGRVVLIVSHRLQFVREADSILVLSGGQLVERGTHDELLEQDGHYASLYEQKPTLPSPAQRVKMVPMLPGYEARPRTLTSPSSQRRSGVLVTAWYSRRRWLWGLVLLSLPFYFFWLLRRLLYLFRLRRSVRPPVPVVVVGNVTAGGTGKTPLVAWLAARLQRRGLKVGIVSRGYGGRSPWYPLLVDEQTTVQVAGDEAWMLRRRVGCPVAVGPDRLAAAALLLQHHGCDLLLADDGLQHWRLGRDAEIVALDGNRRLGNGLMQPAGPLREPSGPRLRKALCAVVKDKHWPDLPCPSYQMTMKPKHFVHLESGQRVDAGEWPLERRIHACAALGNPDSFFNLLRSMGFEVIEHAFPDHYQFAVDDVLFADSLPVIMSEKDAAKCFHLGIRNAWYLDVEPEISGGEAIVDLLLSSLQLETGGQPPAVDDKPPSPRSRALIVPPLPAPVSAAGRTPPAEGY